MIGYLTGLFEVFFHGSPKDKIIFALDVDHFADAQRWVNLLKDPYRIVQGGETTLHHAGPKVVDMIRQKGQKVFLISIP